MVLRRMKLQKRLVNLKQNKRGATKKVSRVEDNDTAADEAGEVRCRLETKEYRQGTGVLSFFSRTFQWHLGNWYTSRFIASTVWF